MRATRKKPQNVGKMKVSRKERICSLCEKPIRKGEKYGKTPRGTVWCKRCS